MLKVLECKKSAKPNKQGKDFWWVKVEGHNDNAYCDQDLTASVGKEVDAEYKANQSGDKTFYSLVFPKKSFPPRAAGMSNKQIALLSAALTSSNLPEADVLKKAEVFEKYLSA